MTSSSDAAAEPIVRHGLPGGRVGGVRSALPITVVERLPPPPPPPRVDAAPLARSLDAGFKALKAQVDAAFGEIERGCVELALAAAETLARGKCQRGELGLEEPLRALLDARRRELENAPAVLRAHPDDAAAIRPKLAEMVPAGARVELVADPATPRGTLALELAAAKVVWSLDEEIAALRRRVLGGAAR
jgi:flagellar biosynthesis/type III secretory pathway protein FliH